MCLSEHVACHDVMPELVLQESLDVSLVKQCD